MNLFKLEKAHSFWYSVFDKIAQNKRLTTIIYRLFGGRQSGKTTGVYIFIIMCCLLLAPNTVGFVGLRASKQNVVEMMIDFMEALDAMKVPYKYVANRRTITINGNKIRFYGGDSRKKQADKWSGLPRLNCKYVFIWMEEAFEFTATDMAGIDGTFRNTNNQGQIIKIQTMNPWSQSHWLVKEMLTKMMWNQAIMSDDNGEGYQIGLFPLKTDSKEPTYELIQYTNWRCNRNNVTKEAIQSFKAMWSYDPVRASVSDWGAAGYEEGRIYSHCLHKIGQARVRTGQQYLIAGLDYGWGNSDRAGVTAAVFGSATLDDGIDLMGEYIQDNRKYKKDVNATVLEIINFYRVCMSEFIRRVGAHQPFPLQVRVDNSAVGVIQMLQNETIRQGLDKWLSFTKCLKQPINDRIEITLWLMGTHKFRLSPNMKLLRAELESAYYEDVETQKRSDTNDHCLNAYEYAIEPFLYKFNMPLSQHSSRTMMKRRLGV